MTEVRYGIVIHTNKNVKLFYRELCAYLTGKVNQEDNVFQGFIDEIVRHMNFDNIVAGLNIDGMKRPCNIFSNKAMVIYFSSMPTRKQVEFIVDRSQFFKRYAKSLKNPLVIINELEFESFEIVRYDSDMNSNIIAYAKNAGDAGRVDVDIDDLGTGVYGDRELSNAESERLCHVLDMDKMAMSERFVSAFDSVELHLTHQKRVGLIRALEKHGFVVTDAGHARPSDFASIDPMGSILQNSESETVAQNIMKILKRNGDRFRLLPWEEYKIERQAAGNFSEREKGYFDRVVSYCSTTHQAKQFSQAWAKVLDGKPETV